MTKVRAAWSFPWVLLVMTAALAAGAEGNPKLFPFPVVEAERMISRWFVDSGYRTLAEDSVSGEKHLSAQKADESWRIVLKPSSPLYTEVFARCTVAGAENAARLEALWSLLDSYAKDSRLAMALSRPATPARDGVVPKVVLQHQEAIICLENGPGSGHIQLSGFVFDDSGLILTTAHDMKEYSALTVITKDGQRFSGRVTKADHLRDLALIQAGFKRGASISLAKGRLSLDLGETIYAIGCPQGALGAIYVGTVNSPPRLANAMPLWQVSMRVLPGSSGSPVFDVKEISLGLSRGDIAERTR